VPLAIVFIQQGLSKFPVSVEDAEAFGLPFFVWWIVSYGELGAGIGLLVGGFFAAKLISISFIPEFGDMLDSLLRNYHLLYNDWYYLD